MNRVLANQAVWRLAAIAALLFVLAVTSEPLWLVLAAVIAQGGP